MTYGPTPGPLLGFPEVVVDDAGWWKYDGERFQPDPHEDWPDCTVPLRWGAKIAERRARSAAAALQRIMQFGAMGGYEITVGDRRVIREAVVEALALLGEEKLAEAFAKEGRLADVEPPKGRR